MNAREILTGLVGSDTVAGELLAHYGSLRSLALDLGGLEGRAGIGPSTAARLRAAIELGAALAREDDPRPVLASPGEAARFLSPRYSLRALEVFGLLALDVRHRLTREVELSTGCLTASLVHPREVFKAALDARAAAVVLFHNHPSGDPEPSAEDLALTRRLAAAGTLLGVEVLDHVVLGAGRYVSLKERGMI